MQTVLWDWNGTLVDDVSMMLDVFNQIAVRHGGRSVTLTEYQAIYRHPVQEMYTAVGVDLDTYDFVEIAREWHALYCARVDDVILHGDAVHVLEALSARGVRQAVLSALEHEILVQSVARYRIDHFFEAVRGQSDRFGHGKVDAGRSLLEELCIAPASVLIIGDSSHDAEVARAVGCDCVLIARGSESAARLAAHGFSVRSTLMEVLEDVRID